MNTFLSVDLDYWTSFPDDKAAVRFFKQVRASGKPVLLVRSHEEMLPVVNASGCCRLINMDEHSDVAGNRTCFKPKGLFEKVELGDGTWVDHVKWRRQGTYIWVTRGYGYCDSYGSGDGLFTTNYHGKATDWKELKVCNWKHVRIPWHDVKLIGVAWSPTYTDPRTVRGVLDFLRLQNHAQENDWRDELLKAPVWIVKSEVKETEESVRTTERVGACTHCPVAAR
jgi:hypothetical protein